MDKGKVYLAGGGCGDADLLTIKALKVLQNCDTVVYDSLVSEKLLQWSRPDCEKIYVGKRYGSHAMKQLEINALLVKKAREGRVVLRLKGGDPYVFGRGGEEFMAVHNAGICCEEIPGITSAIAVPAAAGIPVTHRGLSDSVTVVTGTAAGQDGQDRLKLDFPALARLQGTLVILMGMHHLPEIVVGLLAAGKDSNTPCAVIMEGTTHRQRVLRAPLFELCARADRQGFTSPAVIVIGAVTKLELVSEKRDGFQQEEAEEDKSAVWEYGAFFTREVTVGVTGTQHFADKLSAVLRDKGITSWDMSFMEVRPTKQFLPDFAAYDWLVFTSPNGVRVFLDKMKQERRDLRSLSDKRIAVIGPGTAAVLQETGIYADYMPAVYDVTHLAQGLCDTILAGQKVQNAGSAQEHYGDKQENHRNTQENQKKHLAGKQVLSLRAKQGSDMLSRILHEKGISYAEYPIYELGVQEIKRDAVTAREPDYIVFGSGMGARAYFEGLQKKGLQNTKSRYVCIGEWCKGEVQKYVAVPLLVAEEASVDGIAECICRDAAMMQRQNGGQCNCYDR